MNPAYLALIVATTAAIFALDLVMPADAAIPVLYAGPIVMSLASRQPRLPILLGLLASALTLAGYVISPGELRAGSLADHAIALIVIWIASILCHRHSRLAADFVEFGTRRKQEVAVAESQAAMAKQALKSEQTSRKVTESALEVTAHRYHAVFNQTFQILAILDPTGTVVQANETLLSLFGTGHRAVVGLPIWALPGWHDHGQSQEVVRGAVLRAAQGSFQRDEATVERAGGVEMIVDFSVKPIRSKSGELEFLIFEARDVTDLRHSQEAVAHKQRLEVIGRLTSGVAHDFNNLLAVIAGNVELAVRRAKDPAAVAERLGKALDAVFQGKELTQQLLAFARKQELTPHPVDVRAVAANSLDLLRRTMPETITLSAEVAEGVWPSMVDQTQLQTAILHLAVNARDAMPEGGSLKIRCTNVKLDGSVAQGRPDLPAPDLPAGDYVRIDVIDDGVGIPPAILNSITEPFFTTKAPGEGSGLGLSTVYGFVKQSGGDLQIASEVDRGTTVSLFLPRSPHPPAAPACAASSEPRPASDARILVLEDDERVRDAVTGMLKDAGYDVAEAGDGRSAQSRLGGDGPFDLLLSDVLIPGPVTARETADYARSLYPDIKLLFSSANRETAGRLLSSAAEGEAFIAKPYRTEDLLRAVSGLLAGAGS